MVKAEAEVIEELRKVGEAREVKLIEDLQSSQALICDLEAQV